MPTPLAYFATLVQSDDHFLLLETAACLAHDLHPSLDVQAVLGDVDQLLARLRARVRKSPAATATDLEKLQALTRFFYGELGFGPAVNDFYNPDNSYLNAVLRTRRGIPISLAVVWLELAQGLDLNASGVCFPGHFLVKVRLPQGQILIDPLSGQSLSREALAERLADTTGSVAASGLGREPELPLPLYLQTATPREIIARMLRNLKEIHRSTKNWVGVLAVQARLVLLLPEDAAELRDRGLAHAQLGAAALAVQDLERYLQLAPEAPDAPALANRVTDLRRMFLSN